MANVDALAFWVTEPGRGEIRAESIASPGPDEVMVRTLYTGISRGTETLVFTGRVPESEHERMRAPFQAGDFPAPVKYGYINVGVVEQGPAALESRKVFCLFPHQTRYVVPAAAVLALPETLPPERAVLIANLQTAVNGVWDGEVKAGDRVAVVGAGTVGCLIAWLSAQVPGTHVELIDIDPDKAQAAARLGASFRLPGEAGGEADVVFHATGTGGGLDTALSLAGFEAKVVEMSWFGTTAVRAELGGAFHSKRLTLTASQVGHIANLQRSRWNAARRDELVLRLLDDARLDVLLTGESPFDSLPTVMADLSRTPGSTLCHRIRYA